MMNNSTIDALKAMRFSAMAAEFERQLGDPAAYNHLGFEEQFALMVDAEWNRRQQNRLARCIREVHFAAPGAMIEDIEYHDDRRLDKSQILRFATCKYINCALLENKVAFRQQNHDLCEQALLKMILNQQIAKSTQRISVWYLIAGFNPAEV